MAGRATTKACASSLRPCWTVLFDAAVRRRLLLGELLFDLSEEPAAAAAAAAPSAAPTAFDRLRERLGELQRGGVAGVGAGFERLSERPLEPGWEIGAHVAQQHGRAAQPGDHHFLLVATLERQLPREHLERDDAQRVDVGRPLDARSDVYALGIVA